MPADAWERGSARAMSKKNGRHWSPASPPSLSVGRRGQLLAQKGRGVCRGGGRPRRAAPAHRKRQVPSDVLWHRRPGIEVQAHGKVPCSPTQPTVTALLPKTDLPAEHWGTLLWSLNYHHHHQYYYYYHYSCMHALHIPVSLHSCYVILYNYI